MYYQPKKNTKITIAAFAFLCFSFSYITAQPKSSTAAGAQKIEKLLSETTAAFQAGDLVRAKTLLREILSAAPRSVAANTLAGIVADRENDLAAAEKYFARAAKNAPGAPETRNNYGAILLRLNRLKEAAAEFTASLEINPRQSSALINLAQIRIAEKKSIAARELLEKAKTIAPDAEICRALLAISLELREGTRAAQEFAECAALKVANSSAPNNQSANQSNDQPNNQFNNQPRDVSLAEALLSNNLPDEAKQELETILAVDRQNVGALVVLSKIFLRQKNIRAAGLLLESAVASGLDDAKIYLALAEVYEAGGFPENAIPAMRKAILKDPKNDFYRSRYGLLLVNSKTPAAALVRVEEALKEFPASPSLWFALGIAQFDNNKIPEAQQAFEKALQIDAKQIPVLAYLGAVYVERAQYADAAKIYEQAIQLNESVALLHYLLGDTLLKMTEVDDRRTESALKRAAELDPNLTSAHLTLGRLYVRQTRWTEAAAALEHAAKLEPNRAETFYQLGRVYARLKRADESKATLEKFKQLNDSQKEQSEADRRALVRRLANVRF